jgi:alpha-1,2-mannosyltransferase
VRETFGWGQVALILAILVMADVRALDRGKPWAGVGIGLAAAIKVTPAFFILYLLAARRWRAAATAAGTALAATLLAYAVGPADSVTYWTHALWDTKRVGDPTITTNQSLLGALGRLAAPGSASRLLWLALALAVAAIGLRRAGRAARAGDQLTGMTIAGITAAVVSPISWTHHFYWVVPAAFVLLDLAAGTRAAVRRPGLLRPAAAVGAAVVVLAFGSSLIWYFTGDTRFGHDGLIGTLGNNAYLLISLGLILLLPARVPEARAAARTPAPPIPAGSSPR